MIDDRSRRVCVIGSGSSGLTSAKNLLEFGFEVDVLERSQDLGGNWNYDNPFSRVYRSTHMISSKRFTAYSDFRMPREFPDFPHHTQVLQYLRDYAAHFGVDQCIEYGKSVEQVEPVEGGKFWNVTLQSGETRRYGAVVIANGHHWSPRLPTIPGEFAGPCIHSADYKTPDIFANQRVLVVGGGNSGCDIAVEAVQQADAVFHSTRRGYYYIPKYLNGRPSDRSLDYLAERGIPLFLRRWIVSWVLKIRLGSPERWGLPKPDHRLFETHPIINSLLPYYVRHGIIRSKGDIERLEPDGVRFRDGTFERIDFIVYATGYDITFPFIEPRWLNWQGDCPRLFLNAFHPEFDNLFVAGMLQPDSGLFKLVDWQAKIIARFLSAQRLGLPQADRFRRRKQSAQAPRQPIRYVASPRHLIEVEHWGYYKTLQREVRQLDHKAPISRPAGEFKPIDHAVHD